jgi:hypothetical protein
MTKISDQSGTLLAWLLSRFLLNLLRRFMKFGFSSERSDIVFSSRVVTRLRPVIDDFEATLETEVLV